jgi:hypothetical protein
LAGPHLYIPELVFWAVYRSDSALCGAFLP